jgi:hypothetical protein
VQFGRVDVEVRETTCATPSIEGVGSFRQNLNHLVDQEMDRSRHPPGHPCAATRDTELALAIAERGQIVKGYGDTHARATQNFDLMARTYFSDDGATAPKLAQAIRAAHKAAQSMSPTWSGFCARRNRLGEGDDARRK